MYRENNVILHHTQNGYIYQQEPSYGIIVFVGIKLLVVQVDLLDNVLLKYSFVSILTNEAYSKGNKALIAKLVALMAAVILLIFDSQQNGQPHSFILVY